MNNGSVSSEWARLNIATLAQEGLEAHSLCKASGIEYDDLGCPSVRFPQKKMHKLWDNAVSISQKPHIGLLVARHGLMRSLKPATYTLLSSPSLKQGFARVMPFQHVVSDYTELQMTQTSEGIVLSIEAPVKSARDIDAVHYAAIDSAMIGIVGLVRWVLSFSVCPLRVTLKHSNYSGNDIYTDAFRCPVEFDSDKNSILFSRADFEAPIPTADAGLITYYERIMSSDLERSQMLDIKDFVISEIIKHLPNGTPGVELVASKLFMTARTLQRRLKSESVSFKTLLDKCRQELAVEYLCERKISIEKTAIELGFSENSTFIRAFKRWFSQTPGEYRDNNVC